MLCNHSQNKDNIITSFFALSIQYHFSLVKKEKETKKSYVLEKLLRLRPIVHVHTDAPCCLDLRAVVAVLHPHHQHGLRAGGALDHLLHAFPPALFAILPPGPQQQRCRDDDESSHQQPHQRPHHRHHALLAVFCVQLAAFQECVREQLVGRRARPTFAAVQSDVHDVRAAVAVHTDVLGYLRDSATHRPPGSRTPADGLAPACRGQRVVLQAALSNAAVCVLFGADCVNGVNEPLSAGGDLQLEK